VKLILFDFRCTGCDRIFEDMVKPSEYWTHCPHCSANAQRILSPVRIDRTRIALTENASPESVRHFDRIHKQRKAQEEKTYADHGDYGKTAGSD
jgi:putative FmdB family regulatory protein